jgi:hypothetical protein
MIFDRSVINEERLSELQRVLEITKSRTGCSLSLGKCFPLSLGLQLSPMRLRLISPW